MADLEVVQAPLPQPGEEIAGKQELKNVRSIRVGTGNKAINMTDDGKFKITDSNGNLVILIEA